MKEYDIRCEDDIDYLTEDIRRLDGLGDAAFGDGPNVKVKVEVEELDDPRIGDTVKLPDGRQGEVASTVISPHDIEVHLGDDEYAYRSKEELTIIKRAQ